MLQKQGSQMKNCINNNENYLKEQNIRQQQKQFGQSSQNDSFNYDSQQVLTFQNRQGSFAPDQQISQILRHQREISQPLQQCNPPQSYNDSSLICQETSIGNQSFNDSVNIQKKPIEDKQNDQQKLTIASHVNRQQENLFQSYMRDFNNYKEAFEQYRNVNNNQSAKKNISQRDQNIQQKQNIRQDPQQFTQIQKPNQQSPRRFPKILFAHSSERSFQARTRTLTPPSRSPSQSKVAQKPNISLIEQQNTSFIKGDSFIQGANKSLNMSQSPNRGDIAQINSNSIINRANSIPNNEKNNKINQINQSQTYNSQKSQIINNSNLQEQQYDCTSTISNDQISSNIQKFINKAKNSIEKSQQIEQDENILNNSYQLNKNIINNSTHQSQNITPLNNLIIENNNASYNNRSYVSHSNNRKEVNIKQSQQQYNQSHQSSQHNSVTKTHSIPQETTGNIQNKEYIKTTTSQNYQTPLKSEIINKQVQQIQNSQTKNSPNQSFFSSAVTNTGGQVLFKQVGSQNGSFLLENEKKDNIKPTDLCINSIEYYKMKNEELMNIIKEKDSYINLLKEKDSYVNEFINIKNEFLIIKKKLDEKHKDIDEYKSQILIKSKQIEELSIDNNKLLNQSEVQKKSLLEQQNIFSSIKEQLSIPKNENLSLNNENLNKFILQEVESLKSNIQNKEEIIIKLNEQVNEQKLQVNELQNEVLQRKKENDSLNSQLKVNIQENNELQLLLEDLQTEIATKQKEQLDQNKKIQNIHQYEQVVQKQREDIIQLKQQVDEKSRQLSHSLNELQQLLIDNTNMTDKYNEVITELNQKNVELNEIEINHRRELEQLHSVIKNECAQEIVNEIQNLTKPLLQENKELYEDLTKEKQKIEILMNERSQFQMYEIMPKINDQKERTQKIQNLLDEKINYFMQGNDDISKQIINQLKTENNEIKKTCDIWKAKYKKIQNEMQEVQEQFDEYSKIMQGMKSIQSQMHDQNSSLTCSNSYSSSAQQSIYQKSVKDQQKQYSPPQNSNYKNISPQKLSDIQTHGKQYIKKLQYQENDIQYLEPDAANSLLDTLEGYDLFEQQLKEEIIQDINRFQNNLHGIKSQEKLNNSITNLNQHSNSGSKQSNRQIDICINTNNGTLQNSQISIQKDVQPSPHFQQNSLVTISVDNCNQNNRNYSSLGKPPQNRETINLFGKYQQIQNNYSSQEKLQNLNTSCKPTKNKSHQSSIQSKESNSGYCSQKSSPERIKNYQESINSEYLNQEANASIQQDSLMGSNIHGYSNQANCSTSTQQASAFSQDGIRRRNKRIRSLENKELRLLFESDDENEFQQEIIPNLQNIKIQQRLHNNYIEEENDDSYSDTNKDVKENQISYQANKNQNNHVVPSQKQTISHNNQNFENIRNKKSTDEFSFKNPSRTDHGEVAEQIRSEVSSYAYKVPTKENIDAKNLKQSQQTEQDLENSNNQRNDSINLTKNSCASSMNNMACVESIQLDQDNVDILQQMKDLDKKIEKERKTYEKYLQKCSNCSSDHEKSIEQQQSNQGNNQSSNELKNSVQKTSEELTAMLSVFDSQFENLQKEKLKILNKFKSQEASKKTPTLLKSNETQNQEGEQKNKEEQNIQLKQQSTSIVQPSSQKKSYTFNQNEVNNEKSENNNIEIDELRKRYQKTVQNILGNDRSSNGSKSKQSLNQSSTTNNSLSFHQISNESNINQ